jgi:hypothetical protein
MIDPEKDDDEDKVPTGVEIHPAICTDPLNPEDYPVVAIPSPVVIDNSEDVVVKYDYGIMNPDYIDLSQSTVFVPENALENPEFPPIFEVINTPPAGVTEFNGPGVHTYRKVSQPYWRSDKNR